MERHVFVISRNLNYILSQKIIIDTAYDQLKNLHNPHANILCPGFRGNFFYCNSDNVSCDCCNIIVSVKMKLSKKKERRSYI